MMKNKPNNNAKNSTEFQTPLDFYQDLFTSLTKAKKRIWIQTMNFDPGEKVDEASEIIVQQAKKGLDVQVTVDWISEQYYQSRFDYLPNFNLKWQLEKRSFRKKRKIILDNFHRAGARVTYTNIPNTILSLTPQLGRNHTKIYLIDDSVWIGGINFMPSSFKSYDGMIKSTNPVLVEALATHFHEVNNNKPLTNYAVSINNFTRLLVDNGERGNSLIYNEAIERVTNAKNEIIFISQIVPSGRLLDALLRKAKEGIKVTFITSSHADEMYSTFFPRLLYKHFLSKIKELSTFKLYHVEKKVHLKLLVVDSKELFFGSHNLSELGVQFGTEEIMIHSADENLISQLTTFLDKCGINLKL